MPAQEMGILHFKVFDSATGEVVPFAGIQIRGKAGALCDEIGEYKSSSLVFGKYYFTISGNQHEILQDSVVLDTKQKEVKVKIKALAHQLQAVDIESKKEEVFENKMDAVEDVVITHGKKNEVIQMSEVEGNKATNNGRQIYARIPGLNIWESDGAGIQLGIGGRGLNPSRTSNFNTRQNGYDISADALGYPESYYTPPSEIIDKIQLIRGAASLQFGTQFGGLLNFVLKKGGPEKFNFTYRQSKGSFGLDNFFSSVDGTIKGTNYYVFGNYKNGEDWRPNSGFEVYSAGAYVTQALGKKASVTFEFTKMNYLTQQPGGLTDLQFQLDPRTSSRNRNWFRVDWNLAALQFDYQFKGGAKLNSRFFGLYASREALGFLGQINRTDPGEERTLISGQFRNWGNETRWLKTYTVNKMIWSTLAGFRVYQGNNYSKQGEAPDGSDANFSFVNDFTDGSDYVFPSQNYSVFLEQIFQLNDKFGISPGVRYEHIDTKAAGEFYQSVKDLAGNIIFDSLYQDNRRDVRNIVIAGIGLNYNWKKGHRLYANFSQNYRSINFSDMQIQNPNFKIDPNLRDEKGFNADLGIQGSKGKRFYYDLSVFTLYYNNRIGTTLLLDSVWLNTYQYRTNIASSVTAGVEAFGEYDVLKFWVSDSSDWSLRLFGNLSLVDATYRSSEVPAYDGKKVELVPPVSLKGGVRIAYKDLVLSYQYSYTYQHFSDATNSESQANAVNGIIPSYAVSDLALRYTYKLLQLETGINNLMDESYFTRRATAYPGPGIIPSPPRNFYFALQLKL